MVNNAQTTDVDLKKQLIQSLNESNITDAQLLIKKLIEPHDRPVGGNYFFIAKQLENHPALSDLQELKVAFLSSFAIKSITPFLTVRMFLDNFYAKPYYCPYGQYEQELLNPDSSFYKFSADFVIVFLRLIDLGFDPVFPATDRGGPDIREIEAEILAKYQKYIELINRYQYPQPTIIVHNFEYPLLSVREASVCSVGRALKEYIDGLNTKLRQITNNFSNVKYYDYNYFEYLYGKTAIFNEELWLMSNNPIVPEFYSQLTDEYVRYFKSSLGRVYKCIAVDADNTLWGGIIGEDGFNSIQIGAEYPGNIYREFQKLLLRFYQKGMLLVLLSKNNENDVMHVLRDHPGMVLKEKHFAIIKANWRPKPDNLIECAHDLNIGLDSIVFVDDDPVERELMRSKLPEVLTIDLPPAPTSFKRALLSAQIFEKDIIDEEDRNRGEMYRAEFRRKDFRNNVKTIEDFYRGLEMKVLIREVNEFAITRAASLTQRTNQFNLTTRRYTSHDIEKMLADLNFKLYYLKLADKFGDNGIVGLAIIKECQSKNRWWIDTLLLSCRVLGRTVEDVFMNFIIDKARMNHVRSIIGEYIETPKNSIVKDFYGRFNFKRIEVREDDRRREIWVGVVRRLKTIEHPWFTFLAE